jgi:hypothetical protein
VPKKLPTAEKRQRAPRPKSSRRRRMTAEERKMLAAITTALSRQSAIGRGDWLLLTGGITVAAAVVLAVA